MNRVSTHGAKKHFGQHFLHDQQVLNEIAHAVTKALGQIAAPTTSYSVIEIGPGRGALTRVLLAQLPPQVCLTCLEIDRDLIAYLTQQFTPELASGRLRLIQTDVLDYDFSSLPAHSIVVGNLPYNISSPILFHLLPHAALIDAQIFMLQKEVVDRMLALPRQESLERGAGRVSGRVYGRLSVVLQWRYAMHLLCEVAPEAFTPPPKVWSSVVMMQPHQTTLSCTFSVLEKIVATAFNQRRKQIANSLAGLFTIDQLAACGVSASARAEDLNLTQYVALAQRLAPAAPETTHPIK